MQQSKKRKNNEELQRTFFISNRILVKKFNFSIYKSLVNIKIIFYWKNRKYFNLNLFNVPRKKFTKLYVHIKTFSLALIYIIIIFDSIVLLLKIKNL